MRVAFVGKGGSGKSVIAGTLARALAARGRPVLAVDSDPMPGLAFSLGVATGDEGLPDDVVEETGDETDDPYRLRAGLEALEVVERYAAAGPDGIRFLQMAKLRGPASTVVRSQHAFRLVLEGLPHGTWDVVGDLPGGTRQPFFGWGRYARLLVVVVVPRPASIMSARRLSRLGPGEGASRIAAVVSKAHEHTDVERVEAATGLPVIASVPWDVRVGRADRRGAPVFDTAPDSPAVLAIGSLADRLCEEEGAFA